MILKQSNGSLHFCLTFVEGKGQQPMHYAQGRKDMAQSTKAMEGANSMVGAAPALKLEKGNLLPGGRK